MITDRIRRNAGALPALLLLSMPAFAQYQPASPGRATNTQQNSRLGGQRSDLIFKMQNLAFLTKPCASPTLEKSVLLGCEFEILLDWKDVDGLRQADSVDDINGPDQLVLQYQGLGHWSLESVTLDSKSVFAGANPTGQEAAGPNGGGGVRITPPSSFDAGDYPKANNRQPLVYKFKFVYTPPSSVCGVTPLRVRATYSHTYDGPLRFRVSNAVSVGISVGYPWGVSVSLGGTLYFSNDSIWSKELFEPNGENHWKALNPPDVYAQHSPCCMTPTPPVTDTPPQTPEGSDRPNNNGNGHYEPGESFFFEALFRDHDDGVLTTEIFAESPDGHGLATSLLELIQPEYGVVADRVEVQLPLYYPYDEVRIQLTCMNSKGSASEITYVVPVKASTVPRVEHRSELGTGADELWAFNFLPGEIVTFYTYIPDLPGDLDFDLDVDHADYQRFLTTDWDAVTDLDNLHADLDFNGKVDEVDLGLLLANFGRSDAGTIHIPGCEALAIDVPTFTPLQTVADQNGVAHVELPTEPGQPLRLHYGAFATESCTAAEAAYLLRR